MVCVFSSLISLGGLPFLFWKPAISGISRWLSDCHHHWTRGCLVPIFSQKILGFSSSFYKMKLNIMQNFWQKGSYSLFWILASKNLK